MMRRRRGTSAIEAEDYLGAVFEACVDFGLAVVTAIEAEDLGALREYLIARGAELTVVEPGVDAVVTAPLVDSGGMEHQTLVRWVEATGKVDDDVWREIAVALNLRRETLRHKHRYLWVLAGPPSLRRIMTVHAQDIYSGAYKVPQVIAHAKAAMTWLHLSELQFGAAPSDEKFLSAWLTDLQRQLDLRDTGPDLLMLSGDLAATGRAAEYELVDRFLDRLLDTLERRSGARPILLAVPGNHDLLRPPSLDERWQFELLLRHDEEHDPFAEALRERLWTKRDAGLIERLFPNYVDWSQRRIVADRSVEEIASEPGVCYVRAWSSSHVAGDWSAIVEKDDLRVAIVGLNTAWTSFVPEAQFEGAMLPFEQFEAALGERGLARLDDAHYTVLLTHHGPRSLTPRSQMVLLRQIGSDEGFIAHLHGHAHEGAEHEWPRSIAGLPLFGGAQRSGYLLARLDRDGRCMRWSRSAVLGAAGAWHFEDAPEPEPAAAVISTPELISPDELERYLAKIEALHATAQFIGFDIRIRVALSLEGLYVPLVVGRDSVSGRPLPLAEVFAHASQLSRRGVVVLGDPGSGKTTLLKHILLTIVREGSESLGLPAGVLPVYLSLDSLRGPGVALAELIEPALADPVLDLPSDFGRRLLRRGRLLFLCDGLDAVADVELRRHVADWIESAVRQLPDSFVLVTSRFAGYTGDVHFGANFLELHLLPLDDEQVRLFVRKWYRVVEFAHNLDRESATKLAEGRAEKLLDTLFSAAFLASARVYELTRNPLLLTVICLVHHDHGHLPRARATLFEECIRTLLGRWRERRSGALFADHEDVLEVLRQVAAWMHGQPGRMRASRSELLPLVSQALAQREGLRLDPDRFLQIIRDEVGLLTGAGLDEFGFMQLGFQEFLTAQHLRNQSVMQPSTFESLAARFDDGWWQEVILLFLALHNPSVFEPFMAALVRQPVFPAWAETPMMDQCLAEAASPSPAPFLALLDERQSDGLEAHQLAALRLLARTMPEALDEHEALVREHPNPTIRQWWHLRSSAPPSLRKVIIHERSGIEFVRIPGGTFSMGSPADEVGREDDEGPQHEVALADFYMARTTVTNAQYARYLHANPELAKPRYWSDRRYNMPEQPVVGVSWAEAQAYCEWAGLALPTEAQWEHACRAGTRTRFHVGDQESDLMRIAWYEGNAEGRLHAVRNLEPNAFGLHDMHGNVREWCRDAFGPYTAKPRAGDGLRHEPVGELSRVHRGGGWVDSAAALRSAARKPALPNSRIFSLGFRPILGHPP